MTWGSGPGSGSGSVLSGSETGLVKTMNPDPICPERFDPDPVNIRPESKMVPRICRTHLNKSDVAGMKGRKRSVMRMLPHLKLLQGILIFRWTRSSLLVLVGL